MFKITGKSTCKEERFLTSSISPDCQREKYQSHWDVQRQHDQHGRAVKDFRGGSVVQDTATLHSWAQLT